MGGKDSWLKAALAWFAIITLLIFCIKLFYKPHEELQKTYPQFQTYVIKPSSDLESIVSIDIRSDNLKGDEISAKLKNNNVITTYGPADDGVRAQLRKQADEKQIPINYEKPDEGSAWWVAFFLCGSRYSC